ncbi:hypothetical protein EXW96_18435 [Paenibacillus sp. JMULE4]|uniref:DUF2759 domain-containing protein n=1 Tax=Paenibacillus validus TaxID=44253 RepID=A0A7X3CVH1_9BACL|nr:MULTISPECIES: hypothetical protein [Paenibacillus]MUG73059.1 hypothetical protein [Paenibacillus validus]NTZ19469.1 hypothetical protein [Paenibacillus sp. JMULE4]
MLTIVWILVLVVMGSFFGLAFVRIFQGKKLQASIWAVLLIMSMFLFYFAIAKGYLMVPPQYMG